MQFDNDGYAAGMFDEDGLALEDLVDDSGKLIMTKQQFNDWLDSGDLYEEADVIAREVMGKEHFEDMEFTARTVDAFLLVAGLFNKTIVGGVCIVNSRGFPNGCPNCSGGA